MQLEERASDSKDQEYCVPAAPSPFFAIRYISDPQYLRGDKEETKSRRTRARKPNVQFIVSRTVSRGNFRKNELLQEAALRIVKAGEELFVDYEKMFVF